jgi:hypothetical protein
MARSRGAKRWLLWIIPCSIGLIEAVLIVEEYVWALWLVDTGYNLFRRDRY